MSLLFRPSARDVATIGFLVSRVLIAVGATMLVPAALGTALGEVDAVAALMIGASTAVGLGCIGAIWLPRHHDVRWSDGMVASGLSWLVVPGTYAWHDWKNGLGRIMLASRNADALTTAARKRLTRPVSCTDHP